jgi:hypothetical protein
METQCHRCQHPIQETDIKAELPCHHFFHTLCLLTHVEHQHGNGYYVCECGAHIFPHENENETILEEEIQQQEINHHVPERVRIQTLFRTNAKFKESIQKFKKKTREMKHCYEALVQFQKEKKNEIRTQLLSIRSQLEGLTSLKKSEIQSSQIYKDYMKAKRGFQLLKTRFQRNYNSTFYATWRTLRDQRGFKYYPGFRLSHYSLMVRPWRYTVPI